MGPIFCGRPATSGGRVLPGGASPPYRSIGVCAKKFQKILEILSGDTAASVSHEQGRSRRSCKKAVGKGRNLFWNFKRGARVESIVPMRFKDLGKI
jgi:hypothetical protein